MTAVRRPMSAGIRYAPDAGFRREVRSRVREYFRRTGLSPRADAAMGAKTAILAGWFVASYVGLVFVSSSLASAIPMALSLSLAVTGIGFGISHDANHGAYSHRRWVNRLMSAALDVMGISSYVWRWRHNVAHHGYPNVVGSDADIDLQPFARLASEHPRHSFHRLQHLYLWVLYGLAYLNWHGVEDFRNILAGRIGHHRFPRPRGRHLALLVGGKAVFFTWALAVPALVHPLGIVALFYLGCSVIVGGITAYVIQPAHCTESALSPAEGAAGAACTADEWAVRQVVTTTDYARRCRLVSWYVGGLNFQIEHHLFPTVCHVHYPALSAIVERTCREYGIRYVAHETVWAALASHFRFLQRMGAAPALESVRPTPTAEAA